MNSRPVNYSPLPAARFAGVSPPAIATGFLLPVPDGRSQTTPFAPALSLLVGEFTAR